MKESGKLVRCLSSESSEAVITFREESAREIRYGLVVGTDSNSLLRKLAMVFGCPEKNLPSPGRTCFEAKDNWHGLGDVDLRALADEFTPGHGEFFDFDITISELRALVRSKGRVTL